MICYELRHKITIYNRYLILKKNMKLIYNSFLIKYILQRHLTRDNSVILT